MKIRHFILVFASRIMIQRESNFGIARYATHWHFQKLAGMHTDRQKLRYIEVNFDHI